ncbi:N-6 DNA methylase [Actinomadura sp. NPDC047616]|uniref:N-6 DNA methylase n=1 Tax=Actinomadura sp. NPDC047616 TaxID=3155914 RepID=UPI0033F13BF4
MADDATVTAADIARLAGVGRAAVSNWRKRHDDFPQPVGGTATSPSFSLAEVLEWLRTQGKLKASTADEHLWQELRKAADEVDLADVLAFAGAFLLYRHRIPGHWDEMATRADDEIAAELPGEIRATLAELPGDTTFPEALRPEQVPTLRSLAAMAAERGPLEIFEFLRERYLDLHKRRLYETPREVVRLAFDLIDEHPRTVLDPACGSGAFLLGALDRPRPPEGLMGQDIDDAVARLTALRLALRIPNAQVHAGDSLRHDAFPAAQADLVVSAPPFGDRNWGHDELAADPRWEYGLPPRTESELAWVQHALSHCKPGAWAVLLMAPAVASRSAGRRIRAQLLRRGALRAVVTLPLKAVPNVAVPLALWVLRRPVSDDRLPSQVLMVDASPATMDDFGALAVECWRRFAAAPEDELDAPGRCRAVRIIDLLDEEVDLTPARYITAPAAAPAIERVTEARAEVTALLAGLTDLVPEVEPGDAPSDAPLVTVAELARMSLVTVHRAPPHLAAVQPDEVPASQRSAAPTAVLTGKDVVVGGPPSAVLDGERPDDAVELRTGDVVVPSIIRAPAARVVTDHGTGAGALLGRNLYLLRPDPRRLDPHYLAGVLRSSFNLRHYSVMSSSYRVEVQRAEVSLLPLADQRRYGEVFRRLEELDTRLRSAAERGTELARLIGDGLVDTSLRPKTAIPHGDPAEAG